LQPNFISSRNRQDWSGHGGAASGFTEWRRRAEHWIEYTKKYIEVQEGGLGEHRRYPPPNTIPPGLNPQLDLGFGQD
jgi:hypothetical protein